MRKELVKESRFLSLVLRHDPGAAGIQLDAQGWVEVDVLLAALQARGHKVDLETLKEIVETNEKRRFAISEDGLRIRASQGHSVEVDLELAPAEPPAELFHGTASVNLPSIREQGLLKGSRQHVHLSLDRQTALQVGSRHGRAVVLIVNARQMHADGFQFYLSANKVWPTNRVPAKYLTFPH